MKNANEFLSTSYYIKSSGVIGVTFRKQIAWILFAILPFLCLVSVIIFLSVFGELENSLIPPHWKKLPSVAGINLSFNLFIASAFSMIVSLLLFASIKNRYVILVRYLSAAVLVSFLISLVLMYIYTN